jgi:hypothetical protein
MWGKEGFMAVKIDMSKAYDRVEWVFLKKVICKLGFVPRWMLQEFVTDQVTRASTGNEARSCAFFFPMVAN